MDDATRRDIDKVVWQLLRDAGETEPPVQTEVLLEHLNLYRDFYDLSDPSFIDRAKQKLRAEWSKIRGIFSKLDLKAILFNNSMGDLMAIRSPAFRSRFDSVNAPEVVAIAHGNVRKRRGGPVG